MLAETLIPDSRHKAETVSQGFLKGIPSSSGIAIGNALVIEHESVLSADIMVSMDMTDNECLRFKNAVKQLSEEFEEVIVSSHSLAAGAVAIIDTYNQLINDDFINSKVIQKISEGFLAESAVIREFEYQKNIFRNSKDQILRERVIDLDNIKRRILSALSHHTPDYSTGMGKILVVQTISPTDLVKYKEAGAVGLITEVGGIASHASILARSFEMPAVIGVKDAAKVISNDAGVIIDGFTGLIIYNPDYALSKRYEKRVSEIIEHKNSLGKLAKIKPETIDKIHIRLLANVDRLEDVKSALLLGAEGIGLVRSESLLSNTGKIPDEDIQFGWYREIADRMYPQEVTLRCFDIGSDKFSTGIPLHENNPALGLRGIRYLLYSREIFSSQIRAMLRASVNKNVRIMLPMICDVSELLTAKSIIKECMKELEESGVPFDGNIPVGIMIETPSAVVTARNLAKIADFFSIGTNDLTQYTLAADRTNELVTEYYDSFHPSVLKLIEFTCKIAKEAGISVSICGELAGHAAATPLLIGMGVSQLSVPPNLLPELKNRILNLDYSESKKLSEELLEMNNSHDILKILESEQ
ncbi:MAG: phosphoenolpyruvate--protein phosphotransferase [Candidatus Kapaibacterium sp.]